MPSHRRSDDVEPDSGPDPLGRFTIAGRGEPPPPERSPWRTYGRIAVTAAVVAGLLLLAPRLIGTGVRPTLTQSQYATPTPPAPAARPGGAATTTARPPVTTTARPTATRTTSTAAAPATTTPARTPGSTTQGSTDPGDAAATEQAVLQLVNQARGQHGCGPVTVDDRLTAAAEEHTQDMSSHQMFSHTGSDGSAPWDRAHAAGFPGQSISENIARGYGTAEQVMQAWLDSPGHRANILDCTAKYTGLGHLADGAWWTQMFGH